MGKTTETKEKRDESPLYHNTWKLLQKYRDVVWSLELSIQQVRNKFEIDYGSSIEDFLETIYVAELEFSESNIAHHTECIEKSHKMLKLLENAVELLRSKHKHGEAYYWILYYTFLSPQELSSTADIIEHLHPYVRDISKTTYYRKRQEAVEALSSVLWGYTSKETLDILEEFFPKN